MPNITLYVKDSDLPLINKAKKKLGDSLSGVFIDCVRERITHLETTSVGKMERIVLEFWNEDQEPIIHKSFMGRWLVGGPDDGIRADDESGVSWDAGAEYSVAQTAKGALVVYVRHCNDGFAPNMTTFGSFSEMRDATEGGYRMWPENVIAATAGALDEPYEIELDI